MKILSTDEYNNEIVDSLSHNRPFFLVVANSDASKVHGEWIPHVTTWFKENNEWPM